MYLLVNCLHAHCSSALEMYNFRYYVSLNCFGFCSTIHELLCFYEASPAAVNFYHVLTTPKELNTLCLHDVNGFFFILCYVSFVICVAVMSDHCISAGPIHLRVHIVFK